MGSLIVPEVVLHYHYLSILLVLLDYLFRRHGDDTRNVQHTILTSTSPIVTHCMVLSSSRHCFATRHRLTRHHHSTITWTQWKAMLDRYQVHHTKLRQSETRTLLQSASRICMDTPLHEIAWCRILGRGRFHSRQSWQWVVHDRWPRLHRPPRPLWVYQMYHIRGGGSVS